MNFTDEFRTTYCFWVGPAHPHIMVCHPDTIRPIITTSEPKPLTGFGDYKGIQPLIGKIIIYCAILQRYVFYYSTVFI